MTGVKMRLVDNDIPGPKRDLVGHGKTPLRVVWPDGANVAVNLVINSAATKSGSTFSGRSSPSGRRAVRVLSAGTGGTGRASTRANSSSRREASAYNDDLPYFTEFKGRRHLVVPYGMTYNDMQGSRSPADFLDYRQARTRRALARGRRGLSEDDVRRAASAPDRAGGTHLSAARVHRACPGEGQRLVRATDRHRSLVARPYQEFAR